MNLYPMKLEPVYKDIIWGGNRLEEKYNKKSPFESGKIAESWELALHPEGTSIISNGEYKGMTLQEYIGSDDFSVLIKLIDANSDLSVQVHPAKTEMWYIIEADDDAKLVYGLNCDYDPKSFKEAIESGNVTSMLNYVNVKAGDVYFIPTGLVHAIGKGILIAEIQQNSNVTYRIYDYGRLQNGKPRQLHIEESLKVIQNFSQEDIHSLRYENSEPSSENRLADCRYFTVDKYDLNGLLQLCAERTFHCLNCLSGSGTVNGEKITAGDTYFIPSGFGEYKLEGNMTLIVTSKEI